jgi:alkyl hydroperoxide reductase 1
MNCLQAKQSCLVYLDPTCHISHLPGYIKSYDQLKAKGVDLIACISSNDIFVQDSWGKSQGTQDKILMVSDGNLEFSTQSGLVLDLSAHLMGKRTARFAAILKDGVVQHMAVGDLNVSGDEAILAKL